MANHGETSSAKIHPVFVETSFDTRLRILVDNDESILNFKGENKKFTNIRCLIVGHLFLIIVVLFFDREIMQGALSMFP